MMQNTLAALKLAFAEAVLSLFDISSCYQGIQVVDIPEAQAAKMGLLQK